MKSSEHVDQAEGHRSHNGRRNAHTQKDVRNGLFQSHVQYCRHQSARPGTGARQRNDHQNAKSNGAVLMYHTALQVGFLLQSGDFLIPPLAALPKPGKNVPDVNDDERHRHHVAQHCYRQGQRVVQPQGDPIGQATPQLDDGDHGDEKRGNQLAESRGYTPRNNAGVFALL